MVGKKPYIYWLLSIVILLVFLVSRFYNLLSLPIFTDEAIYIRWAQIAKGDAAWRFISLTDGKQPLFIWIMMFTLKVFQDPLFAGRVVSILGGFIGVMGTGILTRVLFKRSWIAIIAMLFYVILPFTLMYDRLAVYDALSAGLVPWVLLFQVLLARKTSLALAYTLGITMGITILNKSTGFSGIYLLPLSVIFFDFKKENLKNRLLRWILYSGFSIAIAYGMYGILRLSPYYHIINEKNLTFIYTIPERLQHPLLDMYWNLNGMWSWFHTYMTWNFIVLILFGLFPTKQFLKERFILFSWFIIPFVSFAFVAKVLYPRYLLYMIITLIPLMAYGVVTLGHLVKMRLLLVLACVLLCTYPLYVDYKILFSIATAPIPQADRGQLITQWPAGYGVNEVVKYISQQANNGPVFLGTEGTFGLNPASYEMYLSDNKNVEIVGFWPIKEETFVVLQKKADEKPTYYVTKESDKLPDYWKATEVFKVQRGESNSYLHLYKIKGTKE